MVAIGRPRFIEREVAQAVSPDGTHWISLPVERIALCGARQQCRYRFVRAPFKKVDSRWPNWYLGRNQRDYVWSLLSSEKGRNTVNEYCITDFTNDVLV